jgi:hypothetical protein
MANINSYRSDSLALAQDAITWAGITGSTVGRSGTSRVLPDGSIGPETFVRVERVVAARSNAWRVVEATDGTLVGLVLPQAGLPGRYTAHGKGEVA